VLIDVNAGGPEIVNAVGAPLLVNVAVLSGTVGVEVQFVPVFHSVPRPVQVPSTARAGVTTAPTANNTANARTLLTDAAIKPPPFTQTLQ
jgi:hypothetical protein